MGREPPILRKQIVRAKNKIEAVRKVKKMAGKHFQSLDGVVRENTRAKRYRVHYWWRRLV